MKTTLVTINCAWNYTPGATGGKLRSQWNSAKKAGMELMAIDTAKTEGRK
ncbi:hypothetical protein HY995_04800 [Candidatus Micrarchaeota archaeon]|nr:hypothetical protein [Candidatus Micrarchaeota archaeon]MBI5177374.1 hypothetical protein [Candidatus Micrarchaeota archaeon]